jgi:hypothetical protein
MRFFSKRQVSRQVTPSGGWNPSPSVFQVALFDGEEALEVVGESYHQESLWSIVGGPTTEHVRQEIVAILVPESNNPYDPNAISVWIADLQVGFLSRDDAARYRPGLLALCQKHGTPIALRGHVVGGGQRGDGIGFLGVFLDHDPTDFGLAAASISNAPSGGHVRTGRHESGASVSALDVLPLDDAGAIKQLRRLLKQEQDLVARHFTYAELEHRLYHCREVFASALDEFDEACQAHDHEMNDIRFALVAEFDGMPFLETYRQMCIRKQKAHLWEDVITWADRGVVLYGDDALTPEFINDLRQRSANATEKLNPSPRAHRPPHAVAASTDPHTEELTCRRCNSEFTRMVERGRKPTLCPPCRELEETGHS